MGAINGGPGVLIAAGLGGGSSMGGGGDAELRATMEARLPGVTIQRSRKT
jgi:hypothetical protein